MPSILKLSTIRDTELFQRLRDGFRNTTHEQVAAILAPRIEELCGEAADHMKAVPINMPQYTLHDSVHLLRVTELMAKVAGDSVSQLNPVELVLLILSAHFHDHGMVLSGKEMEELEKQPEYQLFRDNWRIEHPNLRAIEAQLASRQVSNSERARLRAQEAELIRGMRTEYIRRTHAKRSRNIVETQYGRDPRWAVDGTPVNELVGLLAESHGHDTSWMSQERGFHYDRAVSLYEVNLPYLGVLLRLADILDLDQDRTPDLLFRAIHFTSPVSVSEWEKHRGVQGWTIAPDLIRYHMEFDHPVYERTARRFMDWIDDELAKCHEVVRQFPAKVADRSRLVLPQRVDRSRIGPRRDAYRYHDLEFTLSRDELVKLLMTDQLYSSPSLCVRELLQNALDALRHRRASYAADGLTWSDGIVKLSHHVDDTGHEILTCTDNGVGMDEDIVRRFLTRAGRSFYRSPEFERERVRFRATGVDFDPCARFGIGFMSCFMLGDRIRILTRRDFGPGRQAGDALQIDINGLDGLVVIRNGPEAQPVGTSVEITGRKKPEPFDDFVDKVRLCAVVDGYALATEFPIVAESTIPETRARVTVPTVVAQRSTVIEKAGVTAARTFVAPFAQMDSRLGGEVRASFLVDAQGLPTLANSEASWKMVEVKGRIRYPALETADGIVRQDDFDRNHSVCVDGILVAGQPGRTARRSTALLGWRAAPVALGASFVLDVRGDLKPELTPAREPLNRHEPLPGWQRLSSLAHENHARLWDELAGFLDRGLAPDVFWTLAAIYDAPLHLLKASTIWSLLPVPVLDDAGVVEWRRLPQLGELRCSGTPKRAAWSTHDGKRLGVPSEIVHWTVAHRGVNLDWLLSRAVGCVVAAFAEVTGVRFVPREPVASAARPGLAHAGGLGPVPIPMEFGGQAASCLSVCFPMPSVNRSHSLFAVASDAAFLSHPSDFQVFARGVVNVLCDPERIASILGEGDSDSRVLKWLGHRYAGIDWSRIESHLHPPYTVWLADAGKVLSIDKAQFERWIEVPSSTHFMDESD